MGWQESQWRMAMDCDEEQVGKDLEARPDLDS